MKDYKDRSKIRNGAPTYEVALVSGGPIIVGEFVERQREDYLTLMRRQLGTNFKELPPQPSEDETHEGCCSC